MQATVYSHFNRNIFTRDSILNNRNKLDALVFKVTMVCGLIAIFLPWGQA